MSKPTYFSIVTSLLIGLVFSTKILAVTINVLGKEVQIEDSFYAQLVPVAMKFAAIINEAHSMDRSHKSPNSEFQYKYFNFLIKDFGIIKNGMDSLTLQLINKNILPKPTRKISDFFEQEGYKSQLGLVVLQGVAEKEKLQILGSFYDLSPYL